MRKKNNLFDLVKSLSPSEKRYFRYSISAKGKDDANFLRLFDELEKMESYDERKVKTKFRREKFSKQLHVTKIYLHDSILKSLRSFHSGNSITLRLKDLIKNIEICFNKELYPLCALEIDKAEKIASRMEDDVSLLEILNWKRKLAQAQSQPTGNLIDIIRWQKVSLQRLNRIHTLWEFMVGLSTDALPEKRRDQSLSESVLLHHLIYRTAIQQRQNDKAKDALEELIQILEANPERIKEEAGIYLSTLNNLLSFLVFTKEYDKALLLLVKAKTFYGKSTRVKENKNNFRQILRTYNIELEIYRDTESLGKAIALIGDIEKLIRQHAEAVPREYLISFWFQFGYVYFLKSDFKSSLRWINEIMNSSFATVRPDLHIQTHFLNLMVHFELKNFFVMRYFVDATKRFANKNQAVRAHHKKIVEFFLKISKAPQSGYKDLFKKFYSEILAENLIPKRDLDYINWNTWITSKIKRI
jgi:tetratricopeptide (TPR) repeat protein